jgi:hypothetical protein
MVTVYNKMGKLYVGDQLGSEVKQDNHKKEKKKKRAIKKEMILALRISRHSAKISRPTGM